MKTSLCMLSCALLACAESASQDLPGVSVHAAQYERLLDDQLRARALRDEDDVVHVELTRTDGAPLFALQLTPYRDTLRIDQLFHADADGLKGAKAWKLRYEVAWESEDLSLEGASQLAAFFYAKVSRRARSSAPSDTYGCDVPGLGQGMSCSAVGGCCDDHDACNDELDCDDASWKDGVRSACQQTCNAPVVACLLGVTASSLPGPAQCCEDGERPCGAPRTRTMREQDAGRIEEEQPDASVDAGSMHDAGPRDASAPPLARLDAGRDAGAPVDDEAGNEHGDWFEDASGSEPDEEEDSDEEDYAEDEDYEDVVELWPELTVR